MIPRGSPYISWTDLGVAALYCATPGKGRSVRRRLEARWDEPANRNTVAFLSVRSGLDAVLAEWALPSGSEIIVSAITIPHILDILAHHRLIAVPVDIDLKTLAVDAEGVQRAITAQTRAILVAHLFGSRMPMDELVAIARAHRLPLIEDCAQAYDGSSYRGHPGSTISMFSFGSIKRQTALGGGLLVFESPDLADRVRSRQAAYAVQSRRGYFRRVLTMVWIKALSARLMFRLFLAVCRSRDWDHDHTLGTALRGFSGGDLFARLRQQPCAPLLRMLDRRLRQSAEASVAQRVAIVQAVTTAYPALHRPGLGARHHRHWLFPMLNPQPDRLMRQLWVRGFDATCGASNLVCVPAPSGRPQPRQAERLMTEVLYLPLYPAASSLEMRAMAAAIVDLISPATRPTADDVAHARTGV